jgi:DNA invertase Pin-like site-specific DNA recombinase
MKVGLYLRVSTEDQTTENQGLVLRELPDGFYLELFCVTFA